MSCVKYLILCLSGYELKSWGKKGHSISAKFSLVETSFAGMGLTFYLKPVMYNGCNIFLTVCAFN